MDPGSPNLDPGLLQAVLADPVLLQAVDPNVLQAVLVSAAAINLETSNTDVQVNMIEHRDFGNRLQIQRSTHSGVSKNERQT